MENTYYIYSGVPESPYTFHRHTVHTLDGVESWVKYERANGFPKAYAVDANTNERVEVVRSAQNI